MGLTGITAGGNESEALQITATTGNTDLISSLVVTYTSPEMTGFVRYTLAAGQSGTAVITVMVRDAGLDRQLKTGDDGLFSRTFTVEVEAPTPCH